MQRALHVFFVVSVLVGIAVAVVLVFWLGGRGARARTPSPGDVRLVAAVTTAAPQGAWLGMTLQPITDQIRKQLKLPRTGCVVSNVAEGSPAAQAGIQVGDLLRQVGETTIKRPEDVPRALKELNVGARVTAVVWRQGQTTRLQLTAAAPPPVGARPPATLPEAAVEVEVAWLGLDIVPLSPKEAAEADVGEAVRGMLVDDVADGRGVDAGIITGDVILAVNGKPTRSIAELKEATRDAAGALVDILRRGRHLYVSVPPPGTTPAERKLAQQRLPLTKVNWDGWGWPPPPPTWSQAWPQAWPQAMPQAAAPQFAPRGVNWDLPPAYGATPPAAGAWVGAPPPAAGAWAGATPGAGTGAVRDPRFEDWRRGTVEDWRRGGVEDWRTRLVAPPSNTPPGMGAFAVGR
jgi:hypothetical protein